MQRFTMVNAAHAIHRGSECEISTLQHSLPSRTGELELHTRRPRRGWVDGSACRVCRFLCPPRCAALSCAQGRHPGCLARAPLLIQTRASGSFAHTPFDAASLAIAPQDAAVRAREAPSAFHLSLLRMNRFSSLSGNQHRRDALRAPLPVGGISAPSRSEIRLPRYMYLTQDRVRAHRDGTRKRARRQWYACSEHGRHAICPPPTEQPASRRWSVSRQLTTTGYRGEIPHQNPG